MLNLKTKTLNKLTAASGSFDKKKFDKLESELNKTFKKKHSNSFVSKGMVYLVRSDTYGNDYGHTLLIQTHDHDDYKFIDDDKYLNNIITPIAKKFGFEIETITQGSGTLGAYAVEIGFSPYESK